MTDTRTLALVRELLTLPAKTAWVGFEQNNIDAEMIGSRPGSAPFGLLSFWA